MLKKIFKKNNGNAKQVSVKDHKIRAEQFSKLARDIVHNLQSKGYEAYIVGGCIRDLLSGIKPKDFDVATNATPEQVTRLFPRSRIIGRRFRIVHVRKGRELIEVTTFRAHHTQGKARQGQQSHSGILVRDNVYGSLEEDARRRDFSCNSFYYDPKTETIFDLCGGFSDLGESTLRTIGDPYERFKEDPVRMLRAVRFEAKLGLQLDEDSCDALSVNRHMMAEVSPARLFDEVIKVLLNESADKAFTQLVDTGLFAQLFPATAEAIEAEPQSKLLIENAMRNTVQRIRQDKKVAPFFLYAALLWPPTKLAFDEFCSRGIAPQEAMDKAARISLERQSARITIPKRFSVPIAEVWKMQIYLSKTSPNRAARTAKHSRFRAGYDFLLLREESGIQTNGLGQWWTEYQEKNPIEPAPVTPRKTKRRPRRNRPTKKPA